jgi:tetratricopeptide (TPR) repeat protein
MLLPLLAAATLVAANWVIVRKDGRRIECSGPYMVVSGQYMFVEAGGKSESLPASDVDAAATAAANQALSKPPAAPSPPSLPAAHELAATTPQDAYEEALRFASLIDGRRFAEISQLLEAVNSAFERDLRLEGALLDTFALFGSSRAGRGPVLDEWIRQSPKSWIAFAARGVYLVDQGYSARGVAWSYQTSPQQFAEMEGYFARAARDLQYSIALHPNLPAYYELLRMSKSGGGGVNESPELLENALRLCPACFELRRQRMVGLEPRWGGSYEAMRQFAAESQQHAAANPRLRLLQGVPYYDEGDRARLDGEYARAVELTTKALSYGEYWAFYYGRGFAYQKVRRYTEALRDLNKAITLRPAKAAPYIARVVCDVQMGDRAAAWRDMDVARVFASADPWRRSMEKWLNSVAPRPGSGH